MGEAYQRPNEGYDQNGKLRVLLVGRHSLIREGLRRLLEQDVSLEVIAEAGGKEEVLDSMQRFHPEVALIDMSLPTGPGIEVIYTIRTYCPSTIVVALLMVGDDVYRGSLQDTGALVILHRGCGHELLTALHALWFDETHRQL